MRARLPLQTFGDNPAGNVAAKLMMILVSDENEPYVHLAAVKLVSDTIQRMLRDGYRVPPEGMRYIFERAMELAESIQIRVEYKNMSHTPDDDKTSA